MPQQVNWGIQDLSQSQPRSKIDLSPAVNIYTALRADKRAQSLADLTLDTDQRKQQNKENIDRIKTQFSKDPKLTYNALIARGYHDAANKFQQEFTAQQKAMEEQQKRQFDMQQAQANRVSKIENEYGTAVKSALNSKNPVDAFMMLREDAVKKEWPISEDFLNYMPTDEEVARGELDPRVRTEMEYISERSMPPKGPMSLEDKLFLMRERYNEKKNLAKTKSQVKIDQPLTEAEKSRERIAKQKVAIAGKKLTLDEEKGERDAELFKQKKIEIARKNRAYKKKNTEGINSIQTFLDRAYSVSKNPNMKKISGGGRYWVGGSEVPIFETEGKDLQADIDFLTDLGVIETMAKLKAESPTGSTGFGALSENEMKTMKNAFSLLGNPEISGAKKKKEVDRIIEIMERRAREERIWNQEQEALLGPELTIEQLEDQEIEGL